MTVFARSAPAASLAFMMLLTACAGTPRPLPGPLVYPRTPPSAATEITAAPSPARPPEMGVSAMPLTTGGPAAARPPAAPASAPTSEEPADVSMAIEQTPLPLFIQILYGNVLRRPFSVDPAIAARTDIVTFKTSQPITRSRMEQLAVALLRSYQVTVQDLDGLIRLVPDNAASAAPPPTLRFGKTLPQTPEALRTAFHHVSLDIVKVGDIAQTLRQIMGNRVTIQEDSLRNGLLLSGTQNDLRTALELIDALDQPRLAGRLARRISPAFLNASEFATRLSDVLTAQGYGVGMSANSTTPILLLPIPVIGSVIAFTRDETTMEHVLKWARELDRPISAQTQNGLYTYPVKFADAQELARTLSEILGAAAPTQPLANSPGISTPSGIAGTAASPAPATTRSPGGRVVVNTATNTLIIRGSNADEYQQLQALLRELDRPVKSAMIEVVVAELRRGGSAALGVEWNVPTQSINSGRNVITGGTLGRLGIGSSGFSVSLGNSAGQLVAQLNALASNNQARILSSPKVMARNGETASIQVGQEVPVVTSQQSGGGTLLGGNQVLQSISYRSTGVILRVRPVINSGNRLDLDVSQEVSSAAETRTGVSSSPTISTRRVETKLSLRDGSTVLLGGLIQRNNSDANTGVPYLKDIPGLGALFRTQSVSDDETELLIMITPYVVSDDFESEAITEALRNSFGDWTRDLRPSRVMTTPPPVVVPPVSAAPTAVAPVAVPAAPASALSTTAASVPPAAPLTSQGTVTPDQPATTQPPAPQATSDVIMSAPQPRPPPAAAAATPPAASASSAADAKAQPARPLPPGSRPVTDPNIKSEIEELLKRNRP